MPSSAFRRLAVSALLLPAFSCLEATQVTFDINTDIPCERLSSTAISVGLEGKVETIEPKIAKVCTKNGKTNIIGTYAVYPKGTKELVAAIKVAVGVGSEIDVKTTCTKANGYKDCVVARRRVSFVPRRSLTVPIDMLLACKDVACDENSTCNLAGRCVSSQVDSTKCTEEGVCSDTVVTGNGLPCANEGTANAIYCKGDNSWCTISNTGMRSCQREPADSGVSFQCRGAEDCGPNLSCVAGSNGILGVCTVMPSAGDTVLCVLGETNTPCPTGPRGCAVDAGPGLFTCLPEDGGIIDHDGGLPCPRTGTKLCDGAKPYCSVITGTPECVADGGAQCWYPGDCKNGNSCYAGVMGTFFNACLPGPTAENPVQLCNELLDGGDCAPGFACNGQFYGLRACRFNDAGVPDAGPVDAGIYYDGGAPGFNIVSLTPAYTTEQGGFAEYTVALNSPPTDLVTVQPVSTDGLEGVTPPGLTLSWNISNWAQRQTVRVNGRDDQLVDGDKVYSVVGAPMTTDPNYSNIPFPTLMFVNVDNDLPDGGTFDAGAPAASDAGVDAGP